MPARGASTEPTPSLSPEEQAAESYRRGVRYRDEALALEEEAAGAAAGPRAAEKARKEFEKAARAFRSAVADDPSLYQAHTELGFALRKLGNYEESLAAYEQALALQPGYTAAIEYRAEAYLGLGRLEAVKEAYLELFRGERGHADQLMAAMKRWVEERRAAPGELQPALVEEFATWVAEREALAGQTADLAVGDTTTPTW
jgi:tetratricopeptide (TPR) repeat protein